jgi:hypothetical protein
MYIFHALESIFIQKYPALMDHFMQADAYPFCDFTNTLGVNVFIFWSLLDISWQKRFEAK